MRVIDGNANVLAEGKISRRIVKSFAPMSEGRRKPDIDKRLLDEVCFRAASRYPIMESDLPELIQDIERNGLQKPIETAIGDDGIEKVIDGRNRLVACLTIAADKKGPISRHVRGFRFTRVELNGTSPEAFTASANAFRRHLPSTERRKLIKDLLKADPAQSDREIARKAGTTGKTVAKQRKQAEKEGAIPKTEKRTDASGRKQPATKEPKLTLVREPLTEEELREKIREALLVAVPLLEKIEDGTHGEAELTVSVAFEDGIAFPGLVVKSVA